MGRRIFTVGHSNVVIDAFLALLSGAGVTTVADVRAYPASRRHPQFGRAALARSCAEHGVAYHWLPELGGRRRAVTDVSPHVAWTVPAFRHYADYADTAEFADALARLEHLASAAPTAFMCAEALWWQCHRRLIADRLVVGGWEVLHVGAAARLTPHRLPDFARVDGARIVYDRGASGALALAPRRQRR